jgi:hypothetical protein
MNFPKHDLPFAPMRTGSSKPPKPLFRPAPLAEHDEEELTENIGDKGAVRKKLPRTRQQLLQRTILKLEIHIGGD